MLKNSDSLLHQGNFDSNISEIGKQWTFKILTALWVTTSLLIANVVLILQLYYSI